MQFLHSLVFHVLLHREYSLLPDSWVDVFKVRDHVVLDHEKVSLVHDILLLRSG